MAPSHTTLRHADLHWTRRDVFQAGELATLVLLLSPAWGVFLGVSRLGLGDALAGAFMPAALGFLLALRCGVVDLSVWAVMGLGGIVAAGVVNAFAAGGAVPGLALPAAVAAAVLIGAILGGLNALLVCRLHLRGFLATSLTGLVVLGLFVWLFSFAGLSVPDNAFDPWVSGLTDVLVGWIGDGQHLLDGPLVMLRMLVVFLAWAGVLLALLARDSAARKNPRLHVNQWARPISLCASGALAALAGACWLIDQGRAPAPTRLVDELTIPVAAILAGTLLLRGPGRTLLAVILLPAAMLLANAWEQTVWPITLRGYSPSTAALGCMALTAQGAFLVKSGRSRLSRGLAVVAAVLGAVGGVLLGFSAWCSPAVREGMISSSLAVGGIGLAMLLWAFFCARRGSKETPSESQ